MTARPAIDCSAQFGGDDCANALLPHFRAFKRSFLESDNVLPCRSIERVAFVFRVSGSVRDFAFEGCENIDFNSRKKYISIDVGVQIARWKGRTNSEIARCLAGMLPDGLDQMLTRLKVERIACDESAIRAMFEQGLAKYVAHWSSGEASAL